MYLRGYSSTQILQALHNEMMNELLDKRIEQEREKEIEARIEAEADRRAYEKIKMWAGGKATEEAIADKVSDIVINSLRTH